MRAPTALDCIAAIRRAEGRPQSKQLRDEARAAKALLRTMPCRYMRGSETCERSIATTAGYCKRHASAGGALL